MWKLQSGKREKERGSSGEPSFFRTTRCDEPTVELVDTIVNNYSQIRHYLPIEFRQRHYKNKRAEIFQEDESRNNSESISIGVNKNMKSRMRIMKLRQRHKENKELKKLISEAVIRCKYRTDPRPYASIKIEGKEIKGLLDSGATVSILGKHCREIVEELNIIVDPQDTNVTTASGKTHRIVGKIEVEVEYQQQFLKMRFYLCPDLEQDLYLGADFWKLFNIAPEIFPIDEITVDLQEQMRGTSTNENKNMHQLTGEQRRRLEEIINKFPTFEKNGLGCTKLEKHAIKLVGNANPVKDRHYPLSPAVQEIVYNEIDKMLALKVIEESDSPWSNRTTVVRKPNKNRFCLDARKLNALTVKDAYPLQNIDGILSRIDQTHFISSVDLKYAFWQIELEEEAKPYTAFTVPGRPLYQFRVMPFGLCNAAQRLCRLMDKVIPGRLKSNVFIYLDDLLIIADDFENHVRILEEVAECLQRANLTIGLKKSLFCFRELKYLGFIIGSGMLKTDPEKVSAIQRIPPPKSPREVRSFLGTAGWYRRFIKDFASISSALTDTLKKGKKFVMTPEAMQSFQSLKYALTSAPVLRHPDFNREFFIQCDASEYGIGAVLFQKNEFGGENPIAFYSQKLNSAQKNYSVTEKECLAAVLAVKRFRPYVELMKFTIITDHASLKWLMSLKDLSGRLARWSLQLQAYDFSIEHRKGSENVVADTLSRMSVESDVIVEELCDDNILDFETTAFESEEYVELRNTIQQNQDRLPDLKIDNDKIYVRTKNFEQEMMEFEWKLWIPQDITYVLIEKAHIYGSSVHDGITKTLKRLKTYFYWPKMSSQVRQFIQNCTTCKETKSANQRMNPTIGNEVITERPFQKLYIDFLGKYPRSKQGNSYIFIVVDHFTKFTFLHAMREATAYNVVKFLENQVFHTFGVPEIIHSDNGKQFASKVFADMIKDYKITHITTAYYSPQSNASERVNQSVLAAIRTYVENDHRDWDLYLAEIEQALRTSVHSATGTNPFFALFGYNMFTSGTDYKLAKKLQSLTDHQIDQINRSDKLELMRERIKENTHQAYISSAKRYNQRARIVKFLPGQEVYRRNHTLSDFKNNINAKFCKKFLKCRVVKPVGNNMYELETLQGKPLGNFHAKDIKI